MTHSPWVPQLGDSLIARSKTGLWVRIRDLEPGDVRPGAGSQWDDWGTFDVALDEAAHRRALVEVAPVIPAVPIAAGWRAVGDMSWHADFFGPNLGSRAINIGISLAPAERGHGIGTVAQSLLAWGIHAAGGHRVEAQTDVANLAEQRCLQAAGFQREGVLRGAQWRADGRHDLVSYSCLPGEPAIVPVDLGSGKRRTPASSPRPLA